MTAPEEPHLAAAGQGEPPLTGDRSIDSALAELAGREELSVAEQLEQLSAAHEVLVQVLENSRR